MAATEPKTAQKRLSQGMRKHIRRIKQDSRKQGLPDKNLKRKLRAAMLSSKEV